VVSLLIPLAISALIGGGILLARRRIREAFDRAGRSMPPLRRKPWHYLRKLRIGNLFDMVRARRSSIMAMVSDIFTHRIRQLGYGLAYGNDRVAPTLLANEIYALESGESHDLPPGCAPLSAPARALCLIAAHMPTKSWFDRLDVDALVKDSGGLLEPNEAQCMLTRPDGSPRCDLDVLVAAGQLTFCFNLLHRCAQASAEEPGLEPLRATLAADWNQLQRDPFSIIDDRLGQGRSADHQSQIKRNTGGNR
jgi:hypothetical protein